MNIEHYFRHIFSARDSALALLWGAYKNPATILVEALVAERARWILWLPVGVSLGIGGYFLLPFEPSLLIIDIGLIIVGVLTVVVFRNVNHWPWAVLMLAPLFGLALIAHRNAHLTAPIIGNRLVPAVVSARIFDVATTENGLRLTLDRLAIDGLAARQTPLFVRVTARGEKERYEPGDWIKAKVQLLPLPEPQTPGGYDFPRQAYFQQLGGLGYTLGPIQRAVLDEGAEDRSGGADATLLINQARYKLTQTILGHLGGASGSIGAALLTGDRGAIPDTVNKAMQDSGLAHILSISGLHLALVAGMAFYVVRLILAAIPFVALRFAIKKWAALAAIAASWVYMVLSGSAVPTERSFLMTAVVMLAIILDRNALSMRLVCWSAVAILIATPESLIDISFQMSFAAVTALVAAYELLGKRIATMRQNSGPVKKLSLHAGAVALTTLVAGAATAPFALYYFDRYVNYSLLANLMAVPLTGLWIMPWGVLALLAMPFGLEAVPLQMMAFGIDWLVKIAEWVAGWPGAVIEMRQLSFGGFLAAVLGGLWFCLWQRRWRYFGLVLLGIGLLSLAFSPRPDLLVDGEGRLMAVRDGDGRLLLSDARSNRFAREAWTRRDGGGVPGLWPRDGISEGGALRCDRQGCIYRKDDQVVALPRRDLALEEDCLHADILIAPFRVAGRCTGPRIVVDRADIRRQGAHAFYFNGEKRVRIETVEQIRGERPWSRHLSSANVSTIDTPSSDQPRYEENDVK